MASDAEVRDVPYIVHEGALARMERQVKRMFIAVVVLIAGLVLTNAAWLYAWCQYDYSGEVIEADQDGEGINIIGGRDIHFGTEGNDQASPQD